MTRVSVVNMAWQRGRDRELLAAACLRADVLLVCEARTRHGDAIALRDLLPAGWETNQDLLDDARAASAVAWRRAAFPWVTTYRPVLMSRARVIGPFRVRARYLSQVVLDTGGPDATRRVERWFAVHPPLAGTARKGEFYDKLSDWLDRHSKARGGGDGNVSSRRRLAMLLGRPIATVRRRQVMFLTTARGDKVVTWSSTHPGSDHPILHALVKAAGR